MAVVEPAESRQNNLNLNFGSTTRPNILNFVNSLKINRRSSKAETNTLKDKRKKIQSLK